jgi:hypothetical protein
LSSPIAVKGLAVLEFITVTSPSGRLTLFLLDLRVSPEIFG